MALKNISAAAKVAAGKGWRVFIIHVRGRDSPTCHNVNREMLLKIGKKKNITAALNLVYFFWLFSTVFRCEILENTFASFEREHTGCNVISKENKLSQV